MGCKVGADPEFFLKKNGEFFSAHDLVPGTKRNPFKLKGGAVQVDGTAVEFNIDPAETAEDFATNIETVLQEIREIVPKEFAFSFIPSVEYAPAYFKKLPSYTKELGCDPDYSADTGLQNKPPKPIGTMRTGAGHVHVGWTSDQNPFDDDHLWDCQQVTKALDDTIYNFSTVWDKNAQRRQMYGKKGSFRPKPYGSEYRVLSNAWLKFPDLWPFLFNVVQKVFASLEQGFFPHKLYPMTVGYQAKDCAKGYFNLDFPELQERVV